MRSRLASAGAVVAASLAGVAASASASPAPPDSDVGGGPSAFDLRSPFWAEASERCTDVLNDHLDRRTGAFDVFLEVLEAGDDAPSADTISGWTDLIGDDIARSDAIRAELAELVVDDPAHADLWDTVVSAADDGVAVQRSRLAALATGDWEEVVAGFEATMGQGGGTSAEASEAIGASPLRGTDCAVVHSWRMPDDESVTREFVTAVTEVCVNVANRRLASTFEDDLGVSLNFLAELLGDDGDPEITAGLEAALDRIVAEWTATVDDFAAIDPSSAPTDDAWADITAVPAERLALFERRLDAVASGDTEAVRSAYDRENFGDHPGWEWPGVGLDHRVCSSLQH